MEYFTEEEAVFFIQINKDQILCHDSLNVSNKKMTRCANEGALALIRRWKKEASAGFWWVSEVNLQVDQSQADVAVRLVENVFNGAHSGLLFPIEFTEEASVAIWEVKVSYEDC